MCQSLRTGPSPTPSNTAPFVGIDQYKLGYTVGSPALIKSITISTNDNAGFAIDTLMLGLAADRLPRYQQQSTPEPGTMLLLTAGCAIGISFRKGASVR